MAPWIVKPELTTLAAYDGKAVIDGIEPQRGIMEFSPVAGENILVGKAAAVHEHIHHVLTTNSKFKTPNSVLQDTVAGVVELRYLFVRSYQQDKVRIAAGEEIPLGTTFNEVVEFLKTDGEYYEIKAPLKHMLNNFSTVRGSSLEKQIAVIKPIAQMHNGGQEVTEPIEKIMDLVKHIEENIFPEGVFDEQIDTIQAEVLTVANNEMITSFEENNGKRAVIIPNAEQLDRDVVAAVLNEQRKLYVYRDNELQEIVATDNGYAMGTKTPVRDLPDAVEYIQYAGFEVRVIADDIDQLADILEESRKIIDRSKEAEKRKTLLFSIEDAGFELKSQKISGVSLSSMILPFVFNIDETVLKDRYEGANRLFLKHGKVWELNVEHIATYGIDLKEAFTQVMNSIKTALRQSIITRQFKIAA